MEQRMVAHRLFIGEPIAALDKVRIIENDEPLVDIAETCPDVLVPVSPQWARLRVAEMLNNAQSLLPQGYRLRIYMAWRPMEQQRKCYRARYRQYLRQHPEWPGNILRRETNRYVAPPDGKTPPGHTTGGAVDLTLVGPDGGELDMISPFKHRGEGGMATFSIEVRAVARQNRQLLYNAMTSAGFSNCAAEWWHYSHGDSAWAVRTGQKNCPYGSVEPPEWVETSCR